MKEIAGDERHVYADARYLKHHLIKKYGDTIFFAEIDGKTDVVCFKNIASSLLNDMWCKTKKSVLSFHERESSTIDEEVESHRIIVTAAKLILNELRSSKYDCSVYPSDEVIGDVEKNKEWLTPGLRLFMESLIRKPLQQASIGQAITHAVKPKSSIPPILFGVAVEMDHLYGSKWQVTELNSLSFSLCPKEVTRYKQSVVCNEDIHQYISESLKGQFGQWTA